MAFRSKTRRSPRKVRDLIWVSRVAELIAVNDTAPLGGEVLLPPDWQVGSQFERATLLRIVGVILFNQTANATSADVPYMGYALYKDAQGLTTFVSPHSATSVSAVDMLRWDGCMLASTASGTNALTQRHEIDIKTKRKLTTGDSIYFTASQPADTVSPTVNVVALLRFLVDRA